MKRADADPRHRGHLLDRHPAIFQIAASSAIEYRWPVLDDAIIDGLNRGYVCPPEAGPAWRAACDYGLDMSLVEAALEMTPEQRLQERQHALNLLLEIEGSRQRNGSR